MAISYSGEGYRLAPQVANLAPLARLQAIDVTRGGGLQYAPLSPIQVPSAQPELVAEGISKGMQSIASGALGGIKAKWEADEAVRLAEAKGAAEAAKEKAKAEAMKEDPLYKAKLAHFQKSTENIQSQIDKRKKGVMHSGFFPDEESATESISTEEPVEGEGMSEVDPVTGENVTKADFETPLPEMTGATTVSQSSDKYNRDVASSVSPYKTMADIVSPQVEEVIGRPLSLLGAGTDAIPAPPKEEGKEAKPLMSIQGVESFISPEKAKQIAFVSPEQAKQVADVRLGLSKAISEAKPVEKPPGKVLEPDIYPITSKAKSKRLANAPLADDVKRTLIRDPKTGQYAYKVEKMNALEVAQKQASIEAKRAAERKVAEDSEYKRTRNVRQALKDYIQEPSIRVLEDNKQGVARFASKVPELYNEYEDLLLKADEALKKGDGAAAASYRRQAVPLINSMFDEVIRLESGKSVTEGQTKLFRDATDAWQKFQREGEALFIGGKLEPRDSIEGLVRTTIMSGNQSAQKANFFIQNLRDLGSESGDKEGDLAKFYPTDIVFSKEIPKIAKDLAEEIKDKQTQLDELKDPKNKGEYSDYNIDVIEKQLRMLEFRKKNIDSRIREATALKSKGKKIPAIIGFNEWYDRPTGVAPLLRKAMPPQETYQPAQ